MVSAPVTSTSPGPGMPFRTVLLATDLTPWSMEATERAIDLSASLSARLLIVNVIDTQGPPRTGPTARIDQARAAREAALVALVRQARARGASAEFLVWTGDPASAIAAAVEAERADLLVVGSRGRRRAGRMLLGSVSDHLVRNAPCPVLVVRPTSRIGSGSTGEVHERE
jgi:nucleotide-binding universal stress UspA family protein